MKPTNLTFAVVLSMLVASTAIARRGGTDIGGGDTVRAFFLNAGDAVISYLTTTSEGQKIVASEGLNIENLEKSLDVNIIKVVDETLIDRTGSLVDALGEKGSITLNKLNWAQHIDSESDVYFLVFHEMLRENGINDDNYVISKALKNFPENLKIKKSLISKKELIASDRLSHVIQKEQIVFGGTGCLIDSARTLTRFDSTTNQFEIYPNEMSTVVGANKLSSDRKGCSIAIPFRAQAGKKIIITQVDLSGDVDLEKSKMAVVTVDTFVAGGKQPIRQTKVIKSGNSDLNAGFLLRENSAAESTCGGEGILRLNSGLVLQDELKKSTTKASYAKVSRVTLSMKAVDCGIKKIK